MIDFRKADAYKAMAERRIRETYERMTRNGLYCGPLPPLSVPTVTASCCEGCALCEDAS